VAPRSALLALSLVAAVGLGIRLIGLHGDLYADEIWITTTAKAPWSVLFREIQEDWNHPPAWHFIVRGVVAVVPGEPPHITRYMALALGVVSIPAIFWVGASIKNHRVGIAAALLLALSPIHIWHSQYGRHYSLLVLLTIVSIGLSVRLLRGDTGRSDVAALFLANLLLVYTHYFGVFLVLAEAILWFALGGRHRRLSYAFNMLLAVFYLPWLLIALRARGADPAVEEALFPNLTWIGEAPSLAQPLMTLAAFNGSVSFPHQAAVGFLLFGGLVTIGAWQGWRDGGSTRSATGLLGMALALPFILVFGFSHLVQPIWFDRVMQISLAPYYLLVALGTVWMFRRAGWLILTSILAVWMGSAYLLEMKQPRRMPYEAVASYLESHSDRSTLLLVENSYLMTPVFYYYEGDAFIYGFNFIDFLSVTPEDHVGPLEDVLPGLDRSGAPVLVVSYVVGEERVRAKLPAAYQLVHRKRFPGLGEERKTRDVWVSTFDTEGR